MGYDGVLGPEMHSRSLVVLLQDSEAVLGWTDMDLHYGDKGRKVNI